MTAEPTAAPPRRHIDLGALVVDGGGSVPLWIGGEGIAGSSTVDDRSPATGEPLAVVSQADGGDIDRAVASARAAAAGWRGLGLPERAARVAELARRLEARLDAFALVDALDTGSLVAPMRAGAGKGAAQLRGNAGVGIELQGRTIPASSSGWHLTKREPFGVVGAISAFNHPTLFACQRIGPPLVAGNTVVLKPSEQAPISAVALAALSADLLPPGVLNVVPGGASAGAALVGHPDVLRIAFTGSVSTGLAVQQAAAASGVVKHVTLELGGKNPLLVLADVDPRVAAAVAVKGMNFTRVQGQSCGSTSRLLVHSSLHDAVVEEVVRLVEAIRIGMPEDSEAEMGSLVSHEHRDRVVRSVEQSVAEGGVLLTGGGPPVDAGLAGGAFMAPTVVDGVDPTMTIARHELFGPVLSVLGWDDLDEAVEIANAVPYGLTASIWTNDLTLALTTADRLDAGYVWINDIETRYTGVPFGGWKQSGIGSEQAMVHELESYTRVKAINIGLGH
jgi:acyl-CoA reductase-like NAD-dependent aldehyde dehydrogenase